MADIGTAEAARRLGSKYTRDKVAALCRTGKIEGATQDAPGKPWHIPESTISKILQDQQK